MLSPMLRPCRNAELGANEGLECRTQAGRKHFGKQSVVCVEKSNWAVIGSIRRVTFLEQRDKDTIKKAIRGVAQSADSRHNGCQQRRQVRSESAVQL